MDVRNGEILAMGSNPTFDPDVFTRPLSQSQVDELYRDPVLSPLTNRAIAGAYPTGSTFKPITSIARPGERRGDHRPNRSSTTALSRSAASLSKTPAAPPTGRSAMQTALQVSSDVFYYTLGDRM